LIKNLLIILLHEQVVRFALPPFYLSKHWKGCDYTTQRIPDPIKQNLIN